MPSTYEKSDLNLADAASADWALAWVRLLTRDVPNAANAYPSYSLDDDELLAHLSLYKVTDESSSDIYYLPHKCAVALLRANPLWIERYSVGGYSEQRPDLDKVCKAILNDYGPGLEALIPENLRPSTGQFGIYF